MMYPMLGRTRGSVAMMREMIFEHVRVGLGEGESGDYTIQKIQRLESFLIAFILSPNLHKKYPNADYDADNSYNQYYSQRSR